MVSPVTGKTLLVQSDISSTTGLSTAVIVYLTLASFVIVMVLVGVWFQRKAPITSSEEYDPLV